MLRADRALHRSAGSRVLLAAGACFSVALLALAGAWIRQVEASAEKEEALKRNYVMSPSAPVSQSVEEAERKSVGCLTCHTASGHKTMHENPGVVIGCTDCHGGNASVTNPGARPSGRSEPRGAPSRDPSPYAAARDRAHILPTLSVILAHSVERQPERHLHAAQSRERRSSSASSTRATSRRAGGLRRLPPADHPGRRAQPDGDHRDALGRRRVQQRHPAVQALHARRGLHARGRAGRDRRIRCTPTPFMTAARASCRSSTRCRPGRRCRRPTSSACSSAAAA